VPRAPALLGFDLGTTRFKVAAFTLDGRLLAAEAERNVEHRDGEQAWQAPAEWWEAAGRLARRLVARRELAGYDVAGVGLSARAGGFVPVDGRGRPLAPSWSDQRHRAELARLVAWRAGGAHLSNYAAGLVAKYLWLRAHEPEQAAGCAHLLYAKDWLVYRMTGRAVTDPTSGPDRHDFDRAAIATLGVAPALLPEVEAPWALAGPLAADGAAQLGLTAGLPVAVGGHDGICANVGAGAGTPGACAITIGTHAVIRAVTTELPAGAYRFYGLPPDRHVIGGNALMAGRAADWFLDSWLAADGDDRSAVFAALDREAERVPPGARGVRFLPFLAGQVAPEARPGARGAFAGLAIEHGRADLYRAVLEGGAFGVRAIWDQVRGWCGDPALVRFTGSGALSGTWRQIIVDAIDWPCEVVDGYAEARGAAIYAAVATGVYADVDAAALAMVHPSLRVTPRPDRVAAYEALYTEWRALADAMRPLDGGGATR